VKRTPLALPAVLLLLSAAALLASCAGSPGPLPSGLTPPEYFQRAQDASERGDYPLALSYYTGFREAFPGDVQRGVWADYEIAFLYHKMGQTAEALRLFDDLLARYEKGGDQQLPDAPRILALKLKVRLQPR
jgi:hypothetical protein